MFNDVGEFWWIVMISLGLVMFAILMIFVIASELRWFQVIFVVCSCFCDAWWFSVIVGDIHWVVVMLVILWFWWFWWCVAVVEIFVIACNFLVMYVILWFVVMLWFWWFLVISVICRDSGRFCDVGDFCDLLGFLVIWVISVIFCDFVMSLIVDDSRGFLIVVMSGDVWYCLWFCVILGDSM